MAAKDKKLTYASATSVPAVEVIGAYIFAASLTRY